MHGYGGFLQSFGTTAGSISGHLAGSGGSRGSRSRLCASSGTTGASTTSLAVPVLGRVTKAFTDSDGFVAELGKSGEHVLGQVHGSLLVDIVANLEPLGTGGFTRGNITLENVLGVLNQSRVIVLVVILKKSVIISKEHHKVCVQCPCRSR